MKTLLLCVITLSMIICCTNIAEIRKAYTGSEFGVRDVIESAFDGYNTIKENIEH